MVECLSNIHEVPHPTSSMAKQMNKTIVHKNRNHCYWFPLQRWFCTDVKELSFSPSLKSWVDQLRGLAIAKDNAATQMVHSKHLMFVDRLLSTRFSIALYINMESGEALCFVFCELFCDYCKNWKIWGKDFPLTWSYTGRFCLLSQVRK